MSFARNMFSKAKTAIQATASFIGYSILNIVSTTALLLGIAGIFVTATAIAELAILEAAYLAIETFVFLKMGQYAGLKILDYCLEKSGMVAHAYQNPGAEFFKTFKPKYKLANDDETSPNLSGGISLESSFSIGPFSISLPWASYSKKIPLEFKDLKNYAHMGCNYLIDMLGLKKRVVDLANKMKLEEDAHSFRILMGDDIRARTPAAASAVSAVPAAASAVPAEAYTHDQFFEKHFPKKVIDNPPNQQANKLENVTGTIKATTEEKIAFKELIKAKAEANRKSEENTKALIFAMNCGAGNWYKKHSENTSPKESADQAHEETPTYGTMHLPAQHKHKRRNSR